MHILLRKSSTKIVDWSRRVVHIDDECAKPERTSIRVELEIMPLHKPLSIGVDHSLINSMRDDMNSVSRVHKPHGFEPIDEQNSRVSHRVLFVRSERFDRDLVRPIDHYLANPDLFVLPLFFRSYFPCLYQRFRFYVIEARV